MLKGYFCTLLVAAILVTQHIGPVLCYQSGAPDSACNTLKPSHSDPGDIGPAPFDITLSQQEYLPGDTIQVQLQRNDSQTFKGFILQVRRDSTGSNQEEKIGTFTNLESGTRHNCLSMCLTGSECSITHTDNSEKTQVTVDWLAPVEPEGDLVFRASFVECYEGTSCSIYWHDIPSEVVTGPPQEPITGSTTTSGGPGQTMPPLAPIDLTDCGLQKGCYRLPADCTGSQDCSYLLTWTSRGEEVDFEISALVSDSTHWTAVGFSLDQSMGDDSVVDCLYDDSRQAVIVQSSWNTALRTNEMLSDPGLGLVDSSLQGSYVDGQVLHCSFTRLTSLGSKALRDDDKIYDLNEPYHILLGKGPVISGGKERHSETPVRTSDKITVSSTEYVNIGGTNTKFPLVITHGSLMIIAWMLLASIGVLMPRYYKNIWKDYMILKKALWFQIHRPVMITVLLITCIAFIVIFIEVGGYATHLEKADAAHPVLGIFVMALVIANPIMAFFRPHPDEPRRPMFNVAHFMVGTSAHVLGGVTLFLGTRLPKAGMSDWAQWIVVTFACWHCLAEIALQLHQYIMNKKGSITPTPSSVDLKSMDKPNGIQNQHSLNSNPSTAELMQMQLEFKGSKMNVPKFETVMIVVHFCVLLALSLTLIVDLAA